MVVLQNLNRVRHRRRRRPRINGWSDLRFERHTLSDETVRTRIPDYCISFGLRPIGFASVLHVIPDVRDVHIVPRRRRRRRRWCWDRRVVQTRSRARTRGESINPRTKRPRANDPRTMHDDRSGSYTGFRAPPGGVCPRNATLESDESGVRSLLRIRPSLLLLPCRFTLSVRTRVCYREAADDVRCDVAVLAGAPVNIHIIH